MHVAIICRDAGGSGSVSRVAWRQALELARELDVELISDTFPGDKESRVRFSRVRFGNFRFLRRFALVPRELAFARAVRRRLLESRNLDFILCHGHVLAARSALPLKRKRNVPFGIVTHADIFDRPAGTYDSRLTALYRWATPRAYRNADLVVALSPSMADLARKGGAAERAIEVIPNGISVEDIGLTGGGPDRAPSTGALRILFVGRLSIEKGVADLIEACRLVAAPIRVTIAGGGPLAEELRTSAAGLPIEFIGPRKPGTVGELYAGNDVTCVPSISEPFGSVVLESLAVGSPVIGTNVGGIPSMVSDGLNGLLVPPSDPPALARAIESLANDRSRLATLASNAKLSVLPRFSWGEVGRLLRKAIAQRVTSR